MNWLAKLLGLDKIFMEGVVKLEKGAVYIIHFKENVTNETCDKVQKLLSERGIVAIIVASDNVKVINL